MLLRVLGVPENPCGLPNCLGEPQNVVHIVLCTMHISGGLALKDWHPMPLPANVVVLVASGRHKASRLSGIQGRMGPTSSVYPPGWSLFPPN